jgi:very-short-patch-repair endonuclease
MIGRDAFSPAGPFRASLHSPQRNGDVDAPVLNDAVMDVVDLVRSHGTIVPSSRLVAEGAKRHLIEEAVAAGLLVRIRRRWVALPDADPFLMRAARSGVILSCVTRARRLGLWTLDDGEKPHVAARPHAGRIAVPKGTTVHWTQPLVPRPPDSLEDGIENVLAAVALCQPHERALAIWESALRQGLVERKALGRMPLSARARALLEEAQLFSDSGLETFIPVRLKWMRLRILPQAWIAGHPVDFLIGERLVLQIDGGHHVGAQRTSDIEHDAQLMLLGYHVIRVGYHQVVDDWPSVQETIMRAVAQGLHLAA